MSCTEITIRTLDHLRDYVYKTICEQNDLEIGAFQITERNLIKASKQCGISFCLHGPRSVQLTAIWDTETNSIRFYGSNGEKMLTTQLSLSIVPVLAAA